MRRRLPYPEAFGHAEAGARRQRHAPHSIASLRRRLAVALARQLELRPCRGRRPADGPSAGLL